MPIYGLPCFVVGQPRSSIAVNIEGSWQVLGCKALHSIHADPIADVLQAMARNTDLPEYEELINAADTVALDLWKSIDGQEIPEGV